MQAAPANAIAKGPGPAPSRASGPWPALPTLVALALCLIWAYWPTFRAMAELWANVAQYSHGFLVPVFALVVLASRRAYLPRPPWRPNWWGAAWLTAALLSRAVAGYLYLQPLDGLTLLPALVGVLLLLGGRPALRWAWPAVAFLAFMLPLPFQVETALAHPLQRVATVATSYVLQTLGLAAFAEGNVIVLEDLRLGVLDACNGLGMLMTFFALATATAMLVRRPLSDRLVLVASAVPIALVVNIMRITATALAHRSFGPEVAQVWTHDLAGWLMMPLALVFLWLELCFLSRLLPPAGDDPGPLPLAVTVPVPARMSAAAGGR